MTALDNAPDPKRQAYRYAAFISYRHVDADRRWAKRLHAALETYRVPSHLVRHMGVRPRVGRVFRDEEELPASADLSHEIESALQQSEFLIVVCSPQTPQSQWVNKEILRFREMGRDGRILALLIEGEPGEAFPPALLRVRKVVPGADGRTTQQEEEVEPLAGDVRPTRTESPRWLWRMARLRLLACILGCRFADLRDRDQERRARRRAIWGGAMTVLAVLMGLLTVFAVVQRNAARQARLQESLQRQRAERALAGETAQRKRAETNLYFNLIPQAYRQFVDNDVRHAAQSLEFCPADLRDWEWRYLANLCHTELRVLPSGNLLAPSLAFSPDSQTVAIADGLQGLKLLDAATGTTRRALLPPGNGACCVAFSSDGRWIAASSGKALTVLDAASGSVLWTRNDHPLTIRRVAFSPDGRLLVSCDGEHLFDVSSRLPKATLKLWDAQTGREIASRHGHEVSIDAAAFSPDGRFLATADSGGLIQLRDGRTAEEIRPLRGHRLWVSALDWTPDSQWLISASGDGSVRWWDPQGAREGRMIQADVGAVNALCISRDGRSIITGGDDRAVHVWDASSGKQITAYRGHEKKVRAVALSPDGAVIASAGDEGVLRMWDAHRNQQAAVLGDNPYGVSAVALSPGNDRLALASYDQVKVWDLGAWKVEAQWTANRGIEVRSLAFNRDGTLLAVPDGTQVNLRHASDGSRAGCLEGNQDIILSLAFDPSGSRIATGSRDGTGRVWDVKTCRAIHTFTGHSASVLAVAFSPDARHVASASHDATVRIWDLQNPNHPVVIVRSPEGQNGCVAFSPSGRHVVFGDGEQVKVCRADTGQETLALLGHTRAVTGVAFSLSGRRIFSCGKDKTVRVWDATTGREILTLHGHLAQVNGLAVNSGVLASCSEDKTVRIWDASATRLGASTEGLQVPGAADEANPSGQATSQPAEGFNPFESPTKRPGRPAVR